MISWVSTRVSFCHDSTSCLATSRAMSPSISLRAWQGPFAGQQALGGEFEGVVASPHCLSHHEGTVFQLSLVAKEKIDDAAWQLARRFLFSSVVAIVIPVCVIPVCVKLMQHYLPGFVYRIDFPWWLLSVGAVFTLLVAFVAVIGCTRKTALSNPIDSIKTE